MDIENLYNEKKQEHNNMTYSIDMLRLKTYISYSKFTQLEFRFKTCWKNFVKKEFCSSKMSNFFYNYVITDEADNSFWVGFLHNTEKRQGEVISRFGRVLEDTYNLTIEFNPNKLKKNDIIFYILSLGEDWYIKSFDLAIDVKLSILDLIWDLSGRSLEKIDNRGYDKKTIYIGKGDGRIKIYNKKQESSLNLLGELTRIEISRELEDFEVRRIKYYEYDNIFPTIYTNNYIYSLGDYKDKTLLGLLYAVQNGFPLRDLTKTYRAKIKKLLQGGYKIKFDNKTVTHLLKQIIFYYFVGFSKIHWC